MKKEEMHIFPRHLTYKKIKEWLFPDLNNINPKIKSELYKQASFSFFLLIFLVVFISLFIFFLSLVPDVDLFSLVKSLSVFIVYFAGILLLHKMLKSRKKDYYLLLFSVFFIATWGVAKDIINFDVIFNRYGILYISLLFFGLIFMPFPPYVALILGLYCACLYGGMWLLFLEQIFGTEWFISLGNRLNIDWINRHIEHITSGEIYIRHWKFHSVWYFAQYIIFGIISAIFRAANIQTYIQTYITNQKLIVAESDLVAIKNLLSKSEDQHIEFKSSIRWDYKNKKINKDLEFVIVKTIAGFLNSEGGTLLLGVDDNGVPVGLEADYKTLNKQNSDGYEIFLIRLVSNYLGKEFCSNVNISFFTINNKEICSLTIQQNDEPVFIEKLGQAFYVRTGSSTQQLNTKEALEYIQKHFE